MDLRVDFAFKLFLVTGDVRRLVAILNAIFENKQIPRVVTGLTIVNPALEKSDMDDKLSVLDVRATLADGTYICIEIHLYDLENLKHKMLRSWSKIYSEELAAGKKYIEQNTTICIAFINGPVTDVNNKPIKKVHTLIFPMERDSHEVLLDNQEMHFINMKAFMEQCENLTATGKELDNFSKWMVLINHKDVKDKEMLARICADGEMKDAMETLTVLSADKEARRAYQRRKDNLFIWNEKEEQLKEYIAIIADTKAQLSDKDAIIADKDAIIAELRAQIAQADKLKQQIS